MGLPSGLLWATCNVGASKPEEYGDYYSWGGSTNKSNEDYFTGVSDLPTIKDTATNKMGGKWRIPTKADFEELINNCNRVLTTQNEIKGYLFSSKINNQYLFLPSAGYFENTLLATGSNGLYWTRTYYMSFLACQLNFYSNIINVYYTSIDRGLSVRAVLSRSDL